MKLGRGPASRRQVQCWSDKSNARVSKSRNKHNFLLRMKLGRRPSFQKTSSMLEWQVQRPSFQVQTQTQFLIRNEAGPKAQLQKDKSNAGVTSPTPQFPSPETNIISTYTLCWRRVLLTSDWETVYLHFVLASRFANFRLRNGLPTLCAGVVFC